MIITNEKVQTMFENLKIELLFDALSLKVSNEIALLKSVGNED